MDRTAWRKASRSGNGNNCVEVRESADGFHIRDSKYLRDPSNDPERQPQIVVPHRYWPAFLSAASGQSAVPTVGPAILVHDNGAASLISGTTTLTFTTDEWSAFRHGVTHGEFDVHAEVA